MKTPTPQLPTPERLEARKSLIRLLAQRLVREALQERQQTQQRAA